MTDQRNYQYSQLQDADHLPKDSSKKITKNAKTKAIVISILLIFLVSYYDELKSPFMSSKAQDEEPKKNDLMSSDVQEKPDMSSVTQEEPKEVNLKSNDEQATPEIAWLLSFPNSGEFYLHDINWTQIISKIRYIIYKCSSA